MENPHNQDSLIIGNCLACQGLVRVPAKTSSNAKVRCPHCTKSFLLSQILDQAVPELEIIQEPNQENVTLVDNGASKDESGRFVVAPQLRRGSKKRRSGSSSGKRSKSRHRETGIPTTPVGDESIETPNDVAIEDSMDQNALNGLASHEEMVGDTNGAVEIADGTNLDIDSKSSKPDRPRNSSRRRSREPRRASDSKKRRSPKPNPYSKANSTGAEILKVLIGGFLAIPIAYLLVLWVFKQDPLKLAPTIVDKAPFLVPSQFRPLEEEADPIPTATTSPEQPTSDIIPDVSDGALAKPKLDPDSFGIK